MTLRQYMHTHGKSVVDIAIAYDCSPQYIWRILKYKIVGQKVLKRLSTALSTKIIGI
jgi:Mor family transcriptional regulator